MFGKTIELQENEPIGRKEGLHHLKTTFGTSSVGYHGNITEFGLGTSFFFEYFTSNVTPVPHTS
jgi:hypothetical protein